ncbi:hypothetical protein ETB97_001147 [Aspergillus alliaceus]|uniref:Lipocalin-like domain-containing protein n=1 Tax=Petromyces alliaceus TaxID=209559 RepID=A0A5N7CDP5_PETAA|nr:uncharacterized protein BDW43DRAFT_306316 [Aspergillus alliaceus]KAB8238456.1 hypothetical protein BDW43DRAFT_306316 [Aspergillus alliaceus]KAE8392275.1 hypothetical protein BDV23DRAFT_181675 [Aspergillus alliaceus]KAF5866069.1 hypothetical protein ETB97_001147 [Aspergillus burnettii]
MRVYSGKLNSESKTAENEVITFVFNSGLQQGSTAVLTGQWTKSYSGDPKANYNFHGTVTKASGNSIEIFKGERAYYMFEGTVDGDKLNLTMKKQDGSYYGKAELELVFKAD